MCRRLKSHNKQLLTFCCFVESRYVWLLLLLLPFNWKHYFSYKNFSWSSEEKKTWSHRQYSGNPIEHVNFLYIIGNLYVLDYELCIYWWRRRRRKKTMEWKSRKLYLTQFNKKKCFNDRYSVSLRRECFSYRFIFRIINK